MAQSTCRGEIASAEWQADGARLQKACNPSVEQLAVRSYWAVRFGNWQRALVPRTQDVSLLLPVLSWLHGCVRQAELV